MKRVLIGSSVVAALLSLSPLRAAWAQKGIPPTSVIVGGHAMASDHDLIDNLAQSDDHTILLGLFRSAGMVDLLHGRGPFTLFAPTDAAFAALPAGMLDSLRRPENKASLVTLLSMELLPGNFSAARLHYLLRAGKGSAELNTVNDAKLTLLANGPMNLAIRDARGGVASITLYDAKQVNGVLFVTDRVLQPN